MQVSDSHQVKLILYYGNKSEDNSIENIEISEPSAGMFFYICVITILNISL
jgi:hypothetical protein